jgi:uncharacterized protein YjeT (DUF2065 family)
MGSDAIILVGGLLVVGVGFLFLPGRTERAAERVSQVCGLALILIGGVAVVTGAILWAWFGH